MRGPGVSSPALRTVQEPGTSVVVVLVVVVTCTVVVVGASVVVVVLATVVVVGSDPPKHPETLRASVQQSNSTRRMYDFLMVGPSWWPDLGDVTAPHDIAGTAARGRGTRGAT
jgi:hypothetical protein